MGQAEKTRTSFYSFCFLYLNKKPNFGPICDANKGCGLSGGYGWWSHVTSVPWRIQRAEAEGGVLTHGLVFWVLWHCSSHVPNLVDLWIILSGFNYANPWKMARWLQKKLPEKYPGIKVNTINEGTAKSQMKQDLHAPFCSHMPLLGKCEVKPTAQEKPWASRV